MSVQARNAAADAVAAGAVCAPPFEDEVGYPTAVFHFQCIGPDREVRWEEEARNIVTIEGKRLHLDAFFGATAKPAGWFLLLKGAGTAAATDTLATHATWTELVPGTAYTGNRPGVTFGASTIINTTGAQVTHATPVDFAILVNNTVIAGAGVCTVATGTAGTLYNAGDFAASRTMGAGDTLRVTAVLQQAA